MAIRVWKSERILMKEFKLKRMHYLFKTEFLWLMMNPCVTNLNIQILERVMDVRLMNICEGLIEKKNEWIDGKELKERNLNIE